MAMPRTASSCGIFCRMDGASRPTWDANPTLSCRPTVLPCAKQKVKSGGKRRGWGARAPDQFGDTKTSKLIAEFHSLADGRKRPVPAGAEAHPQERRL